MKLSDCQKLAVLQAEDPVRPWKSLNETRFCLGCAKEIKGRDVCVVQGSFGEIHLACPTAGCDATPIDWIAAGDPLVSDKAWDEWQERLRFMEVREEHADTKGGNGIPASA